MSTEALLERAVETQAGAPDRNQPVQGENFSDAVWKMRDAFRVFENQSSLLQTQYEGIKKNLAFSNRQLNAKNRALSEKVEELRRMSSRLQCILESLTDGVLVVDEDLRIERCNLAIESMLGLPKEEIEGVPYDQITNGFGNVSMLQLAISNGRSFLDQERSSTTRSGERVTVLASVAPIRSGNGVILGAVEILRNVTTLRFLEERVNCQKRMAALGEMAASVAHEIRNPLGTIEGFARLLKRDLEQYPDHLKLAGKIVEGVQNLEH